MAYGNNYGGMPQPANNLWVGNNYSSGYSQMSRNNYPMNTPAGMPTQVMQQSQPLNNVLQVMGPESAQAYQLGPDSQVILMDSNKPVFYMKRSDSSGYSETRAFKFQEIPLMQASSIDSSNISAASANVQQQAPQPEYVTKSDFEDFKKMIEELVMKNE